MTVARPSPQRSCGRCSSEKQAERIRSRVAEHEFDIGRDEPKRLTCSIGFSYYPFVAGRPSRLTWEQIIVVADRALYAAKDSGRNAWVGLLTTPGTDLGRLSQVAQADYDALVATGLDVRSSAGSRTAA